MADKGKNLPNDIYEDHPDLVKSNYFKSLEAKNVMVISYLLSLLWPLIIAYMVLREGSTFLIFD